MVTPLRDRGESADGDHIGLAGDDRGLEQRESLSPRDASRFQYRVKQLDRAQAYGDGPGPAAGTRYASLVEDDL
ncbi:MAG: hypothetical protein OXD50_11525 [Chloroflexi bacterium]|nr:hypothetical protein [Chloroflexota bacterium]